MLPELKMKKAAKLFLPIMKNDIRTIAVRGKLPPG